VWHQTGGKQLENAQKIYDKNNLSVKLEPFNSAHIRDGKFFIHYNTPNYISQSLAWHHAFSKNKRTQPY